MNTSSTAANGAYLVNFIPFGLRTSYSYVQNNLTVGKSYLVIVQGYCEVNHWGWASSNNVVTFSNVSSSAVIVARQVANSGYYIQSAAYRFTPSSTSCRITVKFHEDNDFFSCSMYILGF